MKIILLLMGIFLSGCASHSGVISDGKDSYIVILSGEGGYTSAGALKIDAYKEANAYCKKRKRQLETISENIIRAGLLSRFSEVDLKFRCISI
jgi:hypothetical protein